MKEQTPPVIEFFNCENLQRDHEDRATLSSIGNQIGLFIKSKPVKSVKRHTEVLHEAKYLLLGLVTLATVTGLCFWLDAPLASAAFAYLVVLVLLSLITNFSSLIVLSLIGVCCLSYFFAPPIHSFRVDNPRDLTTITAFVISSLIVNLLVMKVRAQQCDHVSTCESLRDTNQRLETANAALRNENAERGRAEEALRESEAKLRDYAATASDWLWEIGPDYKFTLLTDNAFGSHPADRIGTACWDHALDLDIESEKWRHLRATLDSRKPFRDFVYCSVAADGAPIYVKASGKPVFDTNGEFRGYRGTGADVTAEVRADRAETELRDVQARLAHVSRVTTLGELTASLAHEVNQPLAGVVSSADACLHWLAAQPPNVDKARRATERILRDAKRASDVVARVRNLAKKAPLQRTWVDINETVEETISLATRELSQNNVSLETQLAKNLPQILADRIQLQQVILNLIINAREALTAADDEFRKLSISTAREMDGVALTVRDTGFGIDPQQIETVFEAFHTTKPGGMGMGLAVSRSIIEGHGGRLWAEPNEPRGAIFKFTIPSKKGSG
jgi:signal transduction histidine kinase